MKTIPLLFALVGLFLASSANCAEILPAEKLKSLQQECFETATKIYEDCVARYKANASDSGMEEVFLSHFAMLEAKLDLCQTRQAKLDVFDLMLKVCDEKEAYFKQRLAAGFALVTDRLKLRLERLRLEIRREKEKEAPEPGVIRISH